MTGMDGQDDERDHSQIHTRGASSAALAWEGHGRAFAGACPCPARPPTARVWPPALASSAACPGAGVSRTSDMSPSTAWAGGRRKGGGDDHMGEPAACRSRAILPRRVRRHCRASNAIDLNGGILWWHGVAHVWATGKGRLRCMTCRNLSHSTMRQVKSLNYNDFFRNPTHLSHSPMRQVLPLCFNDLVAPVAWNGLP